MGASYTSDVARTGPGGGSEERGSPVPRVRGFFLGAAAFFQGVGLLRREPRLVPLVVAPIALACAVYLAVIITGYYWFDAWADSHATAESGSWWSWLESLWVVAKVAFVVFCIAIMFFTFVAIASLLTAPFADSISARAERALRGAVADDGGGIGAFLGDVVRGLGHTLKRQIVYLGSIALALPLLLVPIAGSILFVAILTFATIRLLALDSIDPYLSRRRLSATERSAFARRNRAPLFGFGGCTFLLLLAPFLGALVPPLCVIGGTVLCFELDKRDPSPRLA